MNWLTTLHNTRKDKDIGQKEIADKLGITQQQYSLYETGTRDMPARMIPTICKALKITPDYLFGFK